MDIVNCPGCAEMEVPEKRPWIKFFDIMGFSPWTPWNHFA